MYSKYKKQKTFKWKNVHEMVAMVDTQKRSEKNIAETKRNNPYWGVACTFT